MFEILSIDQAKGRTWDVIVAGSSFASMFFIRALPKDWKVLIVEKGGMQSHADQIADDITDAEEIAQDNLSDRPKRWVAHTLFGGNSNCWWGQAPRFHPHDFELKSRHGVGMDWLLNYADLEPYYDEAERVMEVAGGGSDHILPRARGFPFPPHAPARSEARLRARSGHWVPVPSARSNGGTRAQCCANGVCHRCPVDAKFTILNGLSHFERPQVFVVLGAELRALRIEAGTVKAAHIRHQGGESEIRADLFALGANALFNAAILLRSGLKARALGRYLHEQIAQYAEVDIALPNYYGGTSITGHGYHFYDGVPRGQAAAVLVENFNAPASIRYEPRRWTDRLRLKLIAEDMPREDNRVVLDEKGEPRIEWAGHADYAFAGIERAVAGLQDILPEEIEDMRLSDFTATEAHIQGTTRMGASVEEGAVDRGLVTHEVRNLLALGSGVFPSCSPANPTLTLCALSLHAARALA